MKKLVHSILLMIFVLLSIPIDELVAQTFDSTKVYIVVKNDGARYKVKIISDSPKEIIIITQEIGSLAIPKHEIKQIKEYVVGDEYSKELFSTRYFISTNGLPIKKGDSYYQLTLLGPDIQFGVADNFGVGIITTWIGSPAVIAAKYSGEIKKDVHYAFGTLIGGTLWEGMGGIFTALPFAAITFGDEKGNINIASGFGYISADGESRSQFMLSFAGMKKVTRNGTLVFDSFAFPTSKTTYFVLIPGFRMETSENSAFQIGFPGIVTLDDSTPLGFPMFSWFHKF
jgi:hypothetical protein